MMTGKIFPLKRIDLFCICLPILELKSVPWVTPLIRLTDHVTGTAVLST